MKMDLLKSLEPKYNTLIQAAVVVFLLLVISLVFEKEENDLSRARTELIKRY